jgi:hypothetical protein
MDTKHSNNVLSPSTLSWKDIAYYGCLNEETDFFTSTAKESLHFTRQAFL